VVGSADTPQCLFWISTHFCGVFASHAFSWTAAGGMIDLGTLGGAQSHAADVNEVGTVIGASSLPDSTAVHAFSWTAAGGLVDLGTLGGTTSQALAINNLGQIAGVSLTRHDAEAHAVVWTHGIPSTTDDCKNGRWQSYGLFANQGDCVSFVATRGQNTPR